jgi:pectate lyase
MKTTKFLFLLLFLLNFMRVSAQTYCFTAPQGYGAGTTGGGSGPVTIVTTKAQLQTALTASGNGVVIVQGSLQCDYLSVLVTNKTLLGLPGAKLYTNDQTAGASGILNLKPGSNNVIIRNLIFVGPGAYDSDGRDNLTNEATKLWVDHCEFQDGMDGNFDNKGAGDNISVTWCKFTYLKPPKAGGSGGTDDHRFSNLVGSSDSDYPSDGLRNITWQYCWWAQGCRERMVRARNATLHQLNCYWNSSVTNKAIGLSAGTKGCSDYVESGVFAIPGTVADLSYGGSPTIAFVNCTGGGSNVGTVNKPSYSYEVTPVGSVVSAVTNTSCGAGATLQVTTAGVVSASCGTSNVPVSSVSLAPTSVTINVSGTSQLTATIAPSNATNKSVTWSSSNTSVATVSSSGLVTGVAAGTATITVKTTDGNKTATSAITVNNNSTVTLVYQGENAVINTGVTETKNAGYTGTGYANTDNATGKYVEWTVTTSVAGSFSILFRYASVGDRPADIYVNGTKVISALAFPTTTVWTTWTNTATKTVNLINGVNKIRVTATTSGGCANLDYLQVTGSGTLKSSNVTNVAYSSTKKEIELYPNPVVNVINISGSLKDKGNVTANVYNQLGRLVASKNFGVIESGTLNLSFPADNVKPGLYILKVKMNGEVKTIPFIKK